jgi:hypothetical protein
MSHCNMLSTVLVVDLNWSSIIGAIRLNPLNDLIVSLAILEMGITYCRRHSPFDQCAASIPLAWKLQAY